MDATTLEGSALSPQQRGAWLRAGGRVPPAQCTLRLSGTLDPAALHRGLELLVTCHGVLRTRFLHVPGLRAPIQTLRAADALIWTTMDAGASPSTSPGVDRAIEEERGAVFDRDPRLRAMLVRLGPRDHRLVLTLPALCADRGTLGRLNAAVARGYEAALGGERLSEEPLSYVQFAAWQNALQEGDEADAARHFWRERLVAGGQRVPLTLETPQATTGDVDPRRDVHFLSEELASSMDACGRQIDASLEDVWLAAWVVVLSRVSARPGIVLDVAVPGRDHPTLEEGLGLFARRLPLVVPPLDPGLSYAGLVETVARAREEASEWQDYLEAAVPPEEPGLAFSWENAPPPVRVGELSVHFEDGLVATDPPRLGLALTGFAGGVRAELVYDSRRFRGEDLASMVGMLRSAAAHATRDPGCRVDALELLEPAARDRIVNDLAPGPRYPVPDACLPYLFEAQVERTPDAVAVVYGDSRLTYRELDARANRVAHRLRQQGAGPEALVGVYLERSLDAMVALWGVLKTGAAYVPLDPMEPRQRLARMLVAVRPLVVITASSLIAHLPESAGARLILDALPPEEAADENAAPAVVRRPDGLAYVIHTSGSSGRPKGVMVTHRAAANLAEALSRTVYSDKRGALSVGLNAPLSFDASVKQWLQLLRGHRLHILPEDVRSDPARLLAELRAAPLDVLDCTPTQLRAWMAAGFGHGPEAQVCLLVGGEPLDEDTRERLAALEVDCYNLYGPTECTVDSTVAKCGEADRVHIGRPLANVRVYTLDPELRPVPVGVTGHLHIGGIGLARGYRDQPGATADAFRPDPFSAEPGSRLYRTGDAARFLPGGALEFVGRLDAQIKVRGARVEPGEIEAILEEHPAVQAAAVVARPDARGERRVVAYVRLGAHGALAPHEAGTVLRAFVRERAPEWMVPSEVEALDAFPVTRTGKVDRRSLAERPAPVVPVRPPHLSPRTEIERAIAAVWQEVLQVERVGVHDNFFDLGGHSLLMVRAHNRLRDVLGELSLVDMFRHPTVGALAERLTQGHEALASPVERTQRTVAARRRRRGRRSGSGGGGR